MARLVLGRNTSRPVARRAHVPSVAQEEQPQQQALALRHTNRSNVKVLSKACVRRCSEAGGLQNDEDVHPAARRDVNRGRWVARSPYVRFLRFERPLCVVV